MDAAKRSKRDTLSLLGELAEGQEGYFSASQAMSVGIDRHRLQRLTGQGILERDERGIYRFAAYPYGERGELWRAVLWPSLGRSDALGTLSHATALSLYEVSTISPSTIDITLPSKARIRRAVPPVYRLRFQDVGSMEVTHVFGLPVTTLYRTLFDLIVSSEQHQFVAEALDESPRRGVLTIKEADELLSLRRVGPALIKKISALAVPS